MQRLMESASSRTLLLLPMMLAGMFFHSSSAFAVEGTEVNASAGVWAPLLPSLFDDSGDSVGGVFGLSGHHRFDGYRTSIETRVNYGITDSAEMFGFDALLRDTWSFGIGDLSAGAGYSQMNWQQESDNPAVPGAIGRIDSDYRGAKIIGGWETAFGRRPIWIDLPLGIYDLNGRYRGNDGVGPVTAELSETTTTYGVDVRSDFMIHNVPARVFMGVNVLSDITTWQNGAIGTDDAVVLQGGVELLLF